jgi:hypothetical protein
MFIGKPIKIGRGMSLKTREVSRKVVALCIIVVAIIITAIALRLTIDRESELSVSIPNPSDGDYVVYDMGSGNLENRLLHFNISKSHVEDGFGLGQESVLIATDVSSENGDHWLNDLYVDIDTRQPIVRHRIGMREPYEGGVRITPDVWRYGIMGHLESGPAYVISPYYLPLLVQGLDLKRGQMYSWEVLGTEIRMKLEGSTESSNGILMTALVESEQFRGLRLRFEMTPDSPWPKRLNVVEKVPGSYDESDRSVVVGLQYDLISYSSGVNELSWSDTGSSSNGIHRRGSFADWGQSVPDNGDTVLCPRMATVFEYVTGNETLLEFLNAAPSTYLIAARYVPILKEGFQEGAMWSLEFADETLRSVAIESSWTIETRRSVSSSCLAREWRIDSLVIDTSNQGVLPRDSLPSELLELSSATGIAQSYIPIGIDTEFIFTSDPWLDGDFGGYLTASDLLFFFHSPTLERGIILSAVNGQTYLLGEIRL